MAITEQSRHEMLQACEQALGKEAAMTLAEHLPPVGWADVATRRDLDALEARMGQRFDAVDLRFGAMELRFGAVDLRFDAMDARLDAMDSRIDGIEGRVDGIVSRAVADLRKEITDSQRVLVFAIIGALTANTALVLTASRLFGS